MSLFCVLSGKHSMYQIHHYIDSEDDEYCVNQVSSKDESEHQSYCREDEECDPSDLKGRLCSFLEFHREHRDLADKKQGKKN